MFPLKYRSPRLAVYTLNTSQRFAFIENALTIFTDVLFLKKFSYYITPTCFKPINAKRIGVNVYPALYIV